MDCTKVGSVIAKLRREKGLKQYELAQKLNLSEKTISKWERGLGCPDVSLLNELAKVLGTEIETILKGEIENAKQNNDNIKNLKFYICPHCGNVISSFSDMSVFCCGRKIEGKIPQKQTDELKLSVEIVENEWFVSTERVMTKSDYINFVAYLVCDKVIIAKAYPEWNLQIRFFNYGKGKIVFGNNKGEIFEQTI